MSRINLDPYLFFGGNCKEAMEFYKGIFGGDVTIMTFGDMPGDMQDKEAMNDLVMHAFLDAGDIRLMASDSQQASAKAAKVELSLSGDDEATLRKYFDGLSVGGNVRSPLKTETWGDTFGMLTDKYNIDWMINITTPKA